MSEITVHEIAGGPLREKSLDRPHSLLAVCWYCNSVRLTDRQKWPEAAQLAVLKIRAPLSYDLAAHNSMVNSEAPDRITEEEVAKFEKSFRLLAFLRGPKRV